MRYTLALALALALALSLAACADPGDQDGSFDLGASSDAKADGAIKLQSFTIDAAHRIKITGTCTSSRRDCDLFLHAVPDEDTARIYARQVLEAHPELAWDRQPVEQVKLTVDGRTVDSENGRVNGEIEFAHDDKAPGGISISFRHDSGLASAQRELCDFHWVVASGSKFEASITLAPDYARAVGSSEILFWGQWL